MDVEQQERVLGVLRPLDVEDLHERLDGRALDQIKRQSSKRWRELREITDLHEHGEEDDGE